MRTRDIFAGLLILCCLIYVGFVQLLMYNFYCYVLGVKQELIISQFVVVPVFALAAYLMLTDEPDKKA